MSVAECTLPHAIERELGYSKVSLLFETVLQLCLCYTGGSWGPAGKKWTDAAISWKH